MGQLRSTSIFVAMLYLAVMLAGDAIAAADRSNPKPPAVPSTTRSVEPHASRDLPSILPARNALRVELVELRAYWRRSEPATSARDARHWERSEPFAGAALGARYPVVRLDLPIAPGADGAFPTKLDRRF